MPRISPCSVLALAAALASAAPAASQVRRVSVSAAGVQGNGDSYVSGWDPTGCCVVFYTQATNLFATPDPNKATYVASVNLSTGTVTDLAPGMPTGLAGTPIFPCTLCLSRPEYTANRSALIFYGQAANGLVPGDTSTSIEVFLKSSSPPAITRLTAPGGVAGNGDSISPIITADGSMAAFTTYATNLLPGVKYHVPALFLYNVAAGSLSLAGVPAGAAPANGGAGTPSFSPDGKTLFWATNASNFAAMPAGSTNIFAVSVSGGAPVLVSTNAAGQPGDGDTTHPVLSPSGRYLAFESTAKLFGGDGVTLQVYVKDMTTGSLTMVSTTAAGVAGNGASSHAQWSPGETELVMDSAAANLTGPNPTGSTQIVLKNLQTGHVTCLSLNTAGVPASGASTHAHFSPSGKTVAYASRATDLVANDTNRRADVFVVPVPAKF